MIKRMICTLLAAAMLLSLCLTCAGTAWASGTVQTTGFEADAARAERYFQTLDSTAGERPQSDAVLQGSAIRLSDMIARAEAIVNYTWTPSRDIKTWGGTPYKGETVFPAGQPVRGMPYTLFTYEIVDDGLCTLARYKTLASSNYSVTKYCISVGTTRSGPVYGSCCADLVCEVFGGSFIRGNRTITHSVYGVQDAPCAKTSYNVPISEIRGGDAVSNTQNSHIIWIGEVTDTTLTVYEQTPPVAIKVVVNKAAATDQNGCFVYGGKVYSTVTRSPELVSVDPADCTEHVAGSRRFIDPAHPHRISYTCVNCGTQFHRGETTEYPGCLACPFGDSKPWEDCEQKYTYTVATAPTEQSEGTLKGVCTCCGRTREIRLPKLSDQDYAVSVVTKPTCTTQGVSRYIWKVKDYGKIQVEQSVKKTAHSDRRVAIASTCTEPGFAGKVCTVCGRRVAEGESVALGHQWNAGVVLSPEKPGEDKLIRFTCDRCGQIRDSRDSNDGCIYGEQCPGSRFLDMPKPGNWAHAGVDYVLSRSLFVGNSQDRFAPELNMTRAMVVVVLWRMSGCPAGEKADFVDVKDGKWYTQAVSWAASKKLVQGTGGGRFSPDTPVRREEIATMLYRYAQMLEQDTAARAELGSFPDARRVSGWAQEAMQWAVGRGLIAGNRRTDGVFADPQGIATRAQVATILMRFMENQ